MSTIPASTGSEQGRISGLVGGGFQGRSVIAGTSWLVFDPRGHKSKGKLAGDEVMEHLDCG